MAPSEKELLQYKDGIEGLYDSNSDTVVGNSIPEHAALLYELFFNKAKKNIRIYCKNLCQRIFDKDSVINAFKDAVERKVNIEIMITEDKPESQRFPSVLEQLNIKLNCGMPCAMVNNHPINFCVVDERAYRYEEKNSECKAVACFKDSQIASTLIELFEKIKK